MILLLRVRLVRLPDGIRFSVDRFGTVACEFTQPATGPFKRVGQYHHLGVAAHADGDLISIDPMRGPGVDLDSAVALGVRQRDLCPTPVPCVTAHLPSGGDCGLEMACILEERFISMDCHVTGVMA